MKPNNIENNRDQEGIYITLDELVKFRYFAKGFSFLPTQPVHSILSGRQSSKMRGRGMDFAEMKQFVQGDDTRNIDWKATRRTGKTYIRVFDEERDRRVWILISQRNSMFFGTKERMKSVAAAHLMALASYRVLDSGDRVGAIVYNDTDMKFFKAQRSQQGLMQIFEELVRQNRALNKTQTQDENSQLNKALQHISAVAKHDDLILIIGDGRGADEQSIEYVTSLNMHNDVIFAHIYDPMEQSLPSGSSLFLSDGERALDVDISDSKFQSRFAAILQERKERLQNLSRKQALALLSISTAQPVLDQVMEQLGHALSTKRRG
ncbi:MAG: DUF58 domain-containing protein [Campylobacterota bacterium]|nr:DUF58 domain-containing protein [Campylobacterota bacterium]